MPTMQRNESNAHPDSEQQRATRSTDTRNKLRSMYLLRSHNEHGYSYSDAYYESTRAVTWQHKDIIATDVDRHEPIHGYTATRARYKRLYVFVARVLVVGMI